MKNLFLLFSIISFFNFFNLALAQNKDLGWEVLTTENLIPNAIQQIAQVKCKGFSKIDTQIINGGIKAFCRNPSSNSNTYPYVITYTDRSKRELEDSGINLCRQSYGYHEARLLYTYSYRTASNSFSSGEELYYGAILCL